MVWRDVQSLHIYYPPSHLHVNWGKEIIGKVIKPVVEGYAIRWLWITRYLQPVASTPHLTVPSEFQFVLPDAPDEPKAAFILFRLSIEDQSAHQRTIELGKAAGFFVSDWIEYDVVSDLGSNRFIHADANDAERFQRAHQIAMFMSAVATLLVYSLREENGQWEVESNNDRVQNPANSFFQSVHHLFCNTTEVPLSVLVQSPFANVSVPVRF